MGHDDCHDGLGEGSLRVADEFALGLVLSNLRLPDSGRESKRHVGRAPADAGCGDRRYPNPRPQRAAGDRPADEGDVGDRARNAVDTAHVEMPISSCGRRDTPQFTAYAEQA